MNAIARALANSENSYQLCCQKAAASPQRMFSKGPSGITASHSSLAQAQEQMAHNRGWVFSAVSAISRRIAGQPICAARKAATPRRAKSCYEHLEPLDSHPVLAALENPNDVTTQWGLLYQLSSSLLLCGRAHVWLDGEKLWYLPASWCEPNDRLHSSWTVRPRGTLVEEFVVSGEDMLFAYLPSPDDIGSVQSVLQSQATGVAIDEAIQTAQFRSFRNGLHPGLMLRVGTIDGKAGGEVPVLDDAQRQDLIAAVRKLYGGVQNYGEPMIVDGLIEGVEKLTLTPNEMDFVASAEHIKSRILQAFGISPIIIGQMEGANRAQAVVAEQNFVANVVNPLARLLSDALSGWIAPRYGKGLTVWIEPATADDAEMTLKAYELGLRMGACTHNEYRKAVLNLPDIPGGDERLLPGAMIPESSFKTDYLNDADEEHPDD